MENLIFSLNATVPVFLMMILGIVFRQIGWIDEVFAAKMNQFVFRVSLPVYRSGRRRFCGSVEPQICAVLFCGYIFVHSGVGAAVSFTEGADTARRIYPGCIPQQCSTAWDCTDPEYLRDIWNGTSDDYRKCAAL